MIELARERSPGERIEQLDRMVGELREVALAGIRGRHPEYDEPQARHALMRHIYGDALFQRAWPGAPVLDP